MRRLADCLHELAARHMDRSNKLSFRRSDHQCEPNVDRFDAVTGCPFRAPFQRIWNPSSNIHHKTKKEKEKKQEGNGKVFHPFPSHFVNLHDIFAGYYQVYPKCF